MAELDVDAAIRVLARVLAPEIAGLVVEALRGGGGDRDEWVQLSKAGLPVRTLRGAVKRGELVTKRLGRADYVRRADLDAWIAKRGQEAPAPPEPANDAGIEDPIERAIANGALRRLGAPRR